VRASNAGLTLLEVLVALAILSLTMVALYGAMGDSAFRLGSAQAESVAIALARSKLDEVGHTIPPIVGDASGTAGGYAWTVTIAVHGTPEERVAWPATLIDVAVKVSWGEGAAKRSLAVRTMKIVPKG
jgi:general secretion pathway protein I